MISRDDLKNKNIILLESYQGEKLSFKNDNLVIRDNEDKIKFQHSCYKIFAIFIVGPFTITSGLLQRLNKYSISLSLFTYGFRNYLTINNGVKGNFDLRRKQYLEEDSLFVSKKIIENKIKNQSDTIKLKRDNKDLNVINDLNNYFNQIDKINSFEELMGIEGNASKVYFKCIFDNIDWRGRKPRIKKDIQNLLLDMGYTSLFSLVECILDLFGFDLYKGNLHKEFYMRKSLVCDMVEPFRPIVDYQIRKMFNLKIINENDFYEENEMYYIKRNASKNYHHIILKELIVHKEDIYLYIRNYYRWIKMKDIDIKKAYKGWYINDNSNL